MELLLKKINSQVIYMEFILGEKLNIEGLYLLSIINTLQR